MITARQSTDNSRIKRFIGVAIATIQFGKVIMQHSHRTTTKSNAREPTLSIDYDVESAGFGTIMSLGNQCAGGDPSIPCDTLNDRYYLFEGYFKSAADGSFDDCCVRKMLGNCPRPSLPTTRKSLRPMWNQELQISTDMSIKLTSLLYKFLVR